MRRICAAASVLALITFLAIPAMAAPKAEITATISDVREEESGVLFALSVQMLEPSEPYASLDFSLVCSDYQQLAIVDTSAAGDRSSLDISFVADYGGAYHKGRIDSETGAISYLMGIYSPAGGNAITGPTDVCTVTLCYSGSETVTLSLEGLKLIYKDAEGVISSVRDFPPVTLLIDATTLLSGGGESELEAEIEMEEDSVPLASLEAQNEPKGISPLLIVTIVLAVVLTAAIIILLRRNKQLTQQLAARSTDTPDSNQ